MLWIWVINYLRITALYKQPHSSYCDKLFKLGKLFERLSEFLYYFSPVASIIKTDLHYNFIVYSIGKWHILLRDINFLVVKCLTLNLFSMNLGYPSMVHRLLFDECFRPFFLGTYLIRSLPVLLKFAQVSAAFSCLEQRLMQALSYSTLVLPYLRNPSIKLLSMMLLWWLFFRF